MNINLLYRKVTALLLRHKWFSILLVIMLGFLTLVIVTTQETPSSQQQVTQRQPQQSSPRYPTTKNSQPTETPVALDEVKLYVNDPKIEKTENLPDGTTKYTKKSDVATRPDIIIVRDQADVFNRSVSPITNPPTLAAYIEVFGQPETIINNSRFYGATAKWYLYTTKGMAFVTKNGVVLEVHVFYAMNAEEYIKKFGEDIIR